MGAGTKKQISSCSWASVEDHRPRVSLKDVLDLGRNRALPMIGDEVCDQVTALCHKDRDCFDSDTNQSTGS